MKYKRIIYGAAITFASIYLYQQMIYSFETNKRIITRESLEICGTIRGIGGDKWILVDDPFLLPEYCPPDEPWGSCKSDYNFECDDSISGYCYWSTTRTYCGKTAKECVAVMCDPDSGYSMEDCFKWWTKIDGGITNPLVYKKDCYSLPPKIGNVSQILRVNEDRKKLEWIDPPEARPERDMLAITDPLFKTEAECPNLNEVNGTRFLPLYPFDTPHRGYCLATTDGEWQGVVSPLMESRNTGSYCERTFGPDAYLPPETFWYPHLWNTYAKASIAPSHYRDFFTPEELELHSDFRDLISCTFPEYYPQNKKYKLFASSKMNYYNNYTTLYLQVYGLGDEQFYIWNHAPLYVQFHKPAESSSKINVMCVR